MGLYSHARRMVTMFCTAIILSTVLILMLRLTVFSDMATVTASADLSESVGSIPNVETASNGDISYQLNSKVYYSRADAKGKILILNPETNQYLLNVDIILPETKESLYYTGTIAPGTAIDSAKLSAAGQKLGDGIYECVAEISAIDPETMTPVAKESRDVTIYIGVKP